jgi:hypothetical protein
MTISGQLEAGDTVQSDGALGDEYRIYLSAGNSITIVARGGASRTTTGSNLDMWLELLQGGTELTHDDDSAGSLNSRIVYTAPTSGVYTIRVRTYGGGAKEGAYTLQTYAGALYSQT